MGMPLNKNSVKSLRKRSLYVHNVKLLSRPELESRFTKFLQELEMKDMGINKADEYNAMKY
jgi:hypothetical protein